MADRVYLHVGTPKSGTSYVQAVLWSNRAALREERYLLPGSRQSHYQAMCDLRKGTWYDAAAEGSWPRLTAQVRGHDGTAVISEEMLGAATREQAESAVRSLGPAEVHVVLAVRDLGRSIPSAWQQAVRARAVGGFTDFVAGLRADRNPGFWANQTAVPVLRRWTSLVPAEHRHVVVVPRQGAPRELLWQRFAESVGLDPQRYEVANPAANPSIGAPEAELLRRVNVALGDRFPLNRPYGTVVRRNLTAPVLLSNPTPQRFTLPVEVAAWVEERSAELIDELADFPCDVVGDIEDLRPPAATRTRPPDDFSAEELLELAVDSMVGMLAHTHDRLESWRRTAEAAQRREDRLRAQLRETHRRRRTLHRMVPRWAATVAGIHRRQR